MWRIFTRKDSLARHVKLNRCTNNNYNTTQKGKIKGNDSDLINTYVKGHLSSGNNIITSPNSYIYIYHKFGGFRKSWN